MLEKVCWEGGSPEGRRLRRVKSSDTPRTPAASSASSRSQVRKW